jgi:tape measure domain-containing protein
MADSRDPKIVIRTEYDPKGIKALLGQAVNAAKQMGVIQDKSVRDAQRAEDAKAKAAEKALRQRLALQMKSAQMATAEFWKEVAAKQKAEQQKLAAEQRTAAAKVKQDARDLAAEQRKLDAEVKAVQKAEDAKFRIRLANEEKIRSGLRFLSENQARLNAASVTSSSGLGGPSVTKTLEGLVGRIFGSRALGAITGPLGSGVAGALTGAAAAFKSAMGSAISWIGGAIQTAVGVLLRDIAIGFVNLIRDGINTAVTSVQGVERLFISLTTQGSIENQAKGQDAATAMQNARSEASKYLSVVRQLAIYSPFSIQDVQDIYRVYAAYGLTREQALSLSRGMIDLSSAFMVTGAEANRASLAVAQIIARGRATGEEIRQLVNSGLPLMTKLQEKLGVTKKEFADMAKEGKLTTDVLLPALQELFKEFEGAGERASMTTFTGLLSSLGDIGPMLLQEFFGPINRATGEMEGLFGALIPRLRGFVDFFTNPRTITTVRAWGRQLGEFAKQAFDWADNAFKWGYNLMVQYGNGIIAAGRVVLRALANIGRLIMRMLRPNSPPLILPDIDTWGKETMEQWLLGFTQADANSVFSTLSGELGGLMKSLGAQIEDKSVLPSMLRGLNESLGDLVIAYSSGNGLQEAQLRITSMFSGASQVVQNYVQALLNAQTASNAVAAAERNLATVTKFYEDRLAALDAQIKALQNTQQDITDEVEVRKLNLILNSQFVSEDRKAQARARLEELRLTKVKRGVEEERDAKISAAQATLDAAKLEQEKRQEQLAAAKMMLDFYQQQNDLLNDQIDAIKDLADALKDAAGALGDLGGGDDDGLGALDGLWGDDDANGRFKNVAWDPFAPWREEMAGFKTDWDTFWADLGLAVDAFDTSYLNTVLTGINPTSVVMADVTERNLARLREAWESLPESARNALLGGAIAGVGGKGAMSGVAGAFATLALDVDKSVLSIRNALNLALLAIQGFRVGGTIQMTLFSVTMQIASDLLTGIITGDFETMKTKIIEHVTAAKDDALKLFGAWVVESEEVMGPWYDNTVLAFEGTKNGILAALAQMVVSSTGYINDMIGLFNQLIAAYNSIPWLPDVPSIGTIPLPSAPVKHKAPDANRSGVSNVSTSVTNNYNLGVSTTTDPNVVQKSFNRMKVLGV